jgi:hypothetical protein
MHKVKVNKNYHGVLSVRDYDCIKGVKLGGMQIVHNGKIVLEIDPDGLNMALRNNPNKANKSKFPPFNTYKLVDFRYSKEEADEKQATLL